MKLSKILYEVYVSTSVRNALSAIEAERRGSSLPKKFILLSPSGKRLYSPRANEMKTLRSVYSTIDYESHERSKWGDKRLGDSFYVFDLSKPAVAEYYEWDSSSRKNGWYVKRNIPSNSELSQLTSKKEYEDLFKKLNPHHKDL